MYSEKRMKRALLVVAALVLAGAAGRAQPRIISLTPNGELTWSNYIYRAFYNVESAPTPAGPWSVIGTVADLNWARTNLLSLQVPATNAQAFYRVAWLRPNPLGVWDFQAFDTQGTLVVTGSLTISSMTQPLPGSPFAYELHGSRDLRYVGPETEVPWWLDVMVGTGYTIGTAQLDSAQCSVSWPTNVYDSNVGLVGDLGPNTYTGTWEYWAWGDTQTGPFTAVRSVATNFVGNSAYVLKPKTKKGIQP